MAEHEIGLIIGEILPLIIGIVIAVAGGTAGGLFVAFKSRLKVVTEFFTELDKALADDRVSREELETLWDILNKLFEQNPQAAKALLNSKAGKQP